MKVETYACDNCGEQKKETNHWWKVSEVSQDNKPAGVLVAKWDMRFRVPNIPQMQAVKSLFDVGPEAHLCGVTCVTTWLSKHVLGAGQ